ncbi:WD40/YVTN/BNR-like repeat-containing protein [Thalassotalea euphylliae]|uniref:Photosynthesis system II assembly factor Ycf48/Hcf136-like domain-containing protein n=1 Tax=Thalassotalea euphylliae TaxID=1655234 RepID=A0A3E0UFW0_9GAMM|nr:YCF48-related protein [Thalassotalea euphylliae]REL35779.1 hypothetical protein DXX92_10770 [Thalassotalea euphylliae]
MKNVFAAALCCALATKVYAVTEPMPAIQAPLASKSLLLDIHQIEQGQLVAVGERGHVLLSTDGENWQQQAVPVQSTLTAVTFADEDHGWAVGYDATILATTDGGATWTIQQYLPEKQKPLLDVVFKDQNNGVAIGAYGLFYRTTDGGKNWVEEFHGEFLPEEDIEYLNELKMEDEEAYLDERGSILPHFNKMVMDGRTSYLVGEIGLIAKSNDFGQSWQQFDPIYEGSFFDIERTQQGNLLAAGLRGNVFRSLRNGTPWQHIPTDSTALINDIVLTDDDRLLLLGNGGALLVSEDDGQKFVAWSQPDGKSLIAGVWFNNRLVAVSEDGVRTITIAK